MSGRKDDAAAVLRALVTISRRGLADARTGSGPLSITDQSILLFIAGTPGIRSVDIARELRLNRSTVSRQLSGLVALGLVREDAETPARGRGLALTEVGSAAYRETLDALQAVVDAHLADWTDAEVARFAHDLVRFDRAAADPAAGASD